MQRCVRAVRLRCVPVVRHVRNVLARTGRAHAGYGDRAARRQANGEAGPALWQPRPVPPFGSGVPARPAVRALVMAGFLEVRRGDGTFVTGPRPDRLLDAIGSSRELLAEPGGGAAEQADPAVGHAPRRPSAPRSNA